MTPEQFAPYQNIVYIAASVLFILGMKMLGNASTAKRGNLISSVGMLIAVLVTVVGRAFEDDFLWYWIPVGLIVGGAIGLIAAKKVAMTGMPEMVALFNGFGGLGSLLVGWAEVAKGRDIAAFNEGAVIATILIGGITFTGSMIAWAKLSGKMGGSAIVFPGQKAINAAIFAALLGFGFAWMKTGLSYFPLSRHRAFAGPRRPRRHPDRRRRHAGGHRVLEQFLRTRGSSCWFRDP